MDSIYKRELMIDPSMTDMDAKLSYHKAFMLFMDIAAEHAEHLDIGTGFIKRRQLFWLTVKTKIRFYRRPFQSEIVTFSTWPEVPAEKRCNRSYSVTRQDEVLLEGRTEWAVMEIGTGKVHPMSDVYPEGLEFNDPSCSDDYADITADFSDPDEVIEYKVRPTDIDLGHHMNNTAYVRAVFDTIANSRLKQMDIKDIDVIFLSPCKEGDMLKIERKKTEGSVGYRIVNGEKTAFLMKLTLAE